MPTPSPPPSVGCSTTRSLARRLGEAGRQVEGAGSDEQLVARFLELYERLAA